MGDYLKCEISSLLGHHAIALENSCWYLQAPYCLHLQGQAVDKEQQHVKKWIYYTGMDSKGSERTMWLVSQWGWW
jgi:hypothetical protein